LIFDSGLNWTRDQQVAIDKLKTSSNVFLTGGAGTGKSTVIQNFLRNGIDGSKTTAVLASTGTAAILLGGRTFHSFFGLGIMEGGIDYVVARATKHQGILQRLRKTDQILLDEISMIGSAEWMAAEKIARMARKRSAEPWGGIRMVVIGDFAQLPPVVKPSMPSPSSDPYSPLLFSQEWNQPEKPWCFLTETWHKSEFEAVNLKEIVRSNDAEWNEVLNELRWGEFNARAKEMLDSRLQRVPLDFQGTRLFSRRAQVDHLNHQRLHMLKGAIREYPTVYVGQAQKVDELKRNAPIGENLVLKEGALVMFRQNDPELRFVNGTLGTILRLKESEVQVELLKGGIIDLKPTSFSALDAEGEMVATATNFPLNLAWACTIHKAQGATLDLAHVDLRGVWEHGQSYVALSRVRSLQDLSIEGYSASGFKVDPAVKDFYRRLSRN
jgi:ATP-dependent DNA helicase PIF1